MKWREFKMKVLSRFYFIYTPINKAKLKLNGAEYGKGLKTRGFIRIHNPYGVLIIKENVRINSAEWTNPIGYSNKVNFQIVGNGCITIGSNTGISCASITSAKKVTIGENVLIGAGVKIYDTDFHPLSALKRFSGKQKTEDVKSEEISIGDGSFIAAGTMILKGVHIGDNCVVGAGSIVTSDIPDNQIWAGNPARYIKDNK